MGRNQLIFLLFVLIFNGFSEVETLKQLLKKKFESYSQDDQIIASPPESGDLSSDEDVNLDFISDKGFDDFGLINDDDDDDDDDLKNSAELSLPICGKPEIEPDVNQRIANGKHARPHSWPWQVSLKRRNVDGTYSHSCGGSIISDNVVLTAAHCFSRVKDMPKILVVAGAHDNNKSDEPIQKSKIRDFKMHYFINNTTHSLNDILVLILETPFTFNDKISPVCLPEKNSIASGTCYATGWGHTTGWGIIDPGKDDILKQVRLPVVEEQVCSRYTKRTITSSHLCTGLVEGKSACHGDSGGPFVCLNTHDNRWYLHGITSFGTLECNTITVFTRVVYFLDWIKENAGLSIE